MNRAEIRDCRGGTRSVTGDDHRLDNRTFCMAVRRFEMLKETGWSLGVGMGLASICKGAEEL